MIETLLFLLVFALLIISVCLFASWKTHIDMNKGQNLPYDYVHFKTFIKEFEKYKDDPKLRSNGWKDSIFLQDSIGNDILYLHASIVQINNKCMIFYPLSWWRYQRWINNFWGTHKRVRDL
jgi:hypothetical protein